MSDKRMPALFIGHGSPLNAVEDNRFSVAWTKLGKRLSPPRAILAISAHWETRGIAVTAMDAPRTIHDFYGFPKPLYDVRYPAPGAPWLAARVRELLASADVAADDGWGLDHGSWSVLCRMYPAADVPVVQLSLDRDRTPAEHFALARSLRALREEGVLIFGSGNIVHNLREISWNDTAYPWAEDFDRRVANAIMDRRYEALSEPAALGGEHALAVPTLEHYLPLLYVLAVCETTEEPHFFNAQVTLGSISMRSVRFG